MSDGKQSDLFREILMRQLVESSPVAPTGPTWDALASLLPQAQARPRAFVGFSSTDRWQFTQMLGWNAHEDIDVDFADCQLDRAVKSDDEQYVKSVCREHLHRAGTFVQLIGEDTARKHKYVRWEAEVAIEKECRIIAVNLDHWWDVNPATCPPMLRNVGAMFVSFSPAIVGCALRNFVRRTSSDWCYPKADYNRLGYDVTGSVAMYRQRPRPWER